MIFEAQQTFNREHSRPKSPIARQGLNYQQKVFLALRAALPAKGFTIEQTPWFRYRTNTDGPDQYCEPDILITDLEDAYIIVIEVKLSWVPNALDKLKTLYCPVVSRARSIPTKPLIIAKNSAPGAPPANSRLAFALLTEQPFLLWRDGPLLF